MESGGFLLVACSMCNYKQYLDRQYAVKFFRDNGRDDLAGYYGKITELCRKLGCEIPQDFSAGDINYSFTLDEVENLIPKLISLREIDND